MMTRRQLLELTVSFGAAGAVVLACSEDSTGTGSSSSGGNSSSGGSSGGSSSGGAKDAATDTGSGDATLEFACRSSIAENHGHKLVIPVEDLESTSPKTYSIIGTADHDHQVTFDVQQLAELKAGVSINVTSNDGGQTHDHDIAVKCS